jgi:hypothetical protein
VSIYRKVNGVWTVSTAITNLASGEVFGRSVATDGTLVGVGDGSGPLNGAFPRGLGYIYRRVNNQWTSAIASAPGLTAGDDFGFSAAAGNGRVVFGAPRRDFNAGDDMGAVYAYRINAQGNAELVTNIIHPAFSTQPGEHFGYSVAIAPAGGPNAGMLVVGAPDRDSDSATSTGGIYVFNSTGQGYQLQNIPTQWDENFQFNGLAVATNGSWIMSGAPSFGNARGRVMLYQRQPNGNWETSGFLPGPEGDGGNFGTSISMAGRWASIGAPGFDKVYIWHLNDENVWWQRRVMPASAVGGSTSWGGAVSTNGVDFLGGDPGATAEGQTGAGAVVRVGVGQLGGGDEPWDSDTIELPGSDSSCLRGATATGGGLPDVCGLTRNAADVYYTFVAPHAGLVTADTLGSGFDTVLSAHSPMPVWTDANLLVCNDDIDGANNRQSRVTFLVQQGQRYWLRVAGYSGVVGSYDIHVRYDCPADFNEDGFLDFFDYDDYVQCFETGVCPAGKTADMTGDDFVDFFDYDAFVLMFERGC